MSRPILLTSALGFIGSALARSWPGEERIVNLDLFTYAGDLRRLAELPPGAVQTHRVDVVEFLWASLALFDFLLQLVQG